MKNSPQLEIPSNGGVGPGRPRPLLGPFIGYLAVALGLVIAHCLGGFYSAREVWDSATGQAGPAVFRWWLDFRLDPILYAAVGQGPGATTGSHADRARWRG